MNLRGFIASEQGLKVELQQPGVKLAVRLSTTQFAADHWFLIYPGKALTRDVLRVGASLRLKGELAEFARSTHADGTLETIVYELA